MPGPRPADAGVSELEGESGSASGRKLSSARDFGDDGDDGIAIRIRFRLSPAALSVDPALIRNRLFGRGFGRDERRSGDGGGRVMKEISLSAEPLSLTS